MTLNVWTSLTGLMAAIIALAASNVQAANLLVYNNNDSGAGSLRQAILNNNLTGGGNTIIFSNVVTGTITLTTGELWITNNVTILGPGANVLAVNGNAASRVFNVGAVTSSISGLTITNGFAVSGGGIQNDRSTLTLSNCILSGNSATYGGGIYNDGFFTATLTVVASTFSSNSATYGGGIFNDGRLGIATLTVNTSTFSRNDGGFNGGGIYNHASNSGSGVLVVSASTFSGNTATSGGGICNEAKSSGSATITVSASTISSNVSANGGGIFNIGDAGDAVLAVINSTFSRNDGNSFGGGIYNRGANSGSAAATVSANTFSGNAASAGGGILNEGFSGNATLEIGNTTLKAGSVGANIFNAGTFTSVTSDGYNLSSDNAGGFLNALGDQINTEPLLGPLQNNGGPTATHLPLAGSPAIDQGKNLAGLTTDQRNRCRIYDNPGIVNATGGDGSDIGAVELNPAHSAVVSTNADSGAGSLRYCLCDALPGESLTFAVTGTVALTSGELLISRSVTIIGPTATGVTVSGNNTSRVFHVTGGTVNISGLTIANGSNLLVGAGIMNEGDASLSLSNCTVTANYAVNGGGGGLYNSGVASLCNSTVASNNAGIGGGIYNNGALLVLNSTIASNVTHSTPFSMRLGGGVFQDAIGTATIRSSIIAGNTAVSGGPDVNGTFSSSGYNLIGNVTGATGFTGTGDQTGVDPKLGPLADNGGPTMTMALRVGSPAIDKGKSFGLTTDQRGQPRYDNPNIANASSGDGADIGAYEATELRIVNAQRTGNHLRLDFLNWLGTNYEVQSRSDLTTGSWGSLFGGIPGNGGIASTTVSNVFGVPKQFYRIHPVP